MRSNVGKRDLGMWSHNLSSIVLFCHPFIQDTMQLLVSGKVVSDSATPWTVLQASLSFTISQSLLKLMSIELVMPSNHLILSCLLLLPSIFQSIRVFSNKSAFCIRWPNYWSFSISPFSEYSGLITFRIDWFDLLAVQRTQTGHIPLAKLSD